MTTGSVWQRSGPELVHAFLETLERSRQHYAMLLELIEEMAARGIHSDAGYGSLRQYLSHWGRLHPREAARMVRHAADTPTATREAAGVGCWIVITLR